MPAQSTLISPLSERGVDTHAEKRKIHFMKVTTEYLPISGLKIPRYIEKLRLFRMIMKMPNGVLSAAPPDTVTLLIIKYMIPMKLTATPMDFLSVIGSLMAIAATAIV